MPLAVKQGRANAVLPWPPTKESLDMLYREGKPTKEIASLYGCAPVTIRQHRKRLAVKVKKETLAERMRRFSAHRDNGCIEWIGARMPSGYGVVFCHLPNHHRTAKAHRIAWELANNASLLPGALIMHECDNPSCVNPAHLTLGTHMENSAQAKVRGRLRPLRGENSERAKLTEAKVLDARARYVRGASIPKMASEYGVKYPALYNAVRGRTWAWLK